MRPVTSIDVAKRAGVSQATVSRALRDQRGTSEETRRRVREVARELGYVPLQSGRSLSTRQSRRVGVVVGELANPFYPALVDPIVKELKERGYLAVLLHDDDVHGPDAEPIFDGSLDGVVLTTERRDSALPGEIERRGIPSVLVNREIDGTTQRVDVPDNAAGAAAVADLLVELGHSRPGLVAGPSSTSTGRQRRDAFRDQLARHGVALHPDHVVEVDFTIEAGRSAAASLLRAPARPTALFCANDVLALGALEAAADLGLRVPEHLTVIGFDDIPMSSLGPISLTTVSVDLDSLARHAVVHLLASVTGGPAGPARTVHPVELVLRGTHAPPLT